ncbi:hypothetical protein Pmi06nite_64000 [Planotetraspora mira]|uniref:Uncharacterized protein n=1 Tax=Planotetraspora mira TaxID=58121 RepID=A0A8J3XDZ0_9ACTN|nr:hypothetical protein Pmi06nite_64000 [Planotetraspora mira]
MTVDGCGECRFDGLRAETMLTCRRSHCVRTEPVAGKPGSKMHVLSDANGLPLLVGVSAANAVATVVLGREIA